MFVQSVMSGRLWACSANMLWEAVLTLGAVSWSPTDGCTIPQSHRLCLDDAMGLGGSPEHLLQLTNALLKMGRSQKGVALGGS